MAKKNVRKSYKRDTIYSVMIAAAIAASASQIALNLVMKFITGLPSVSPTRIFSIGVVTAIFLDNSPLEQAHIVLGLAIIAVAAAIFAVSVRRGLWNITFSGLSLMMIIGATIDSVNFFESGFSATTFYVELMVDLVLSIILYLILFFYVRNGTRLKRR